MAIEKGEVWRPSLAAKPLCDDYMCKVDGANRMSALGH